MVQHREFMQPTGKGQVTVVLVLVAALVLGGAVWYVIARGNPFQQETTNQPVVNETTSNTDTTVRTIPPDPQQADDQDRDGLTDEEEATRGTNPASSDTDQDGLSDLAEVNIYQSNPLVADSDGDGTFDGAEVKAGTNPNGPGKLLDVSQAINALNLTNQ